MTTKHTSGPWAVGTTDGHDPYNVTGLRGALPYIARIPGDRLERGANARLIGAAPELLAALQELVAEWDARHADEDHRTGYTLDTYGVQLARSAVAKATGEA